MQEKNDKNAAIMRLYVIKHIKNFGMSKKSSIFAG